MSRKENVKNALLAFREERDWAKFHSPANLAKSISIEAAELLECFQWSDDNFDRDEAKMEVADVLTYAFYLAYELDLDPEEIILEKLRVTNEKYPVEKARGKSTKYDKL